MKLHWTNGLKVSRDLGIELLGAEGMLVGQDLPAEGTVQHFFLSMPSASIAGGSDEVQHNIIGERALDFRKMSRLIRTLHSETFQGINNDSHYHWQSQSTQLVH